MMDKEKINKAQELLQEAGLKASLMFTMDDKQHSLHMKGSRWDLIELMVNAMENEDFSGIVSASVLYRTTVGKK